MEIVSGNVKLDGMELIVLCSAVTVVTRTGVFNTLEHVSWNVLMDLLTFAAV